MQVSPFYFVAIDSNFNTFMMNQSYLDALGYTLEEVQGRNYLEMFIPEDEREQVRNIFTTLLSQGNTLSENTVITKKGSNLLIEWHGHPVITDGDLNFFIGIGLDITEQRTIFDERNIVQERYQLFMDSSTEGFAIFDRNLNFVEVNKTWLKNARKVREEVIGRYCEDVLPNLKETGRTELYKKVLETGEPFLFENVLSSTGTALYNINAFKVGEGLGIIVTNITENALHEERLKAVYANSLKLTEAKSLLEVAKITFDTMHGVLDYTNGGFAVVEGDELNNILIKGEEITEFRLPLNGKGITVRAVTSGQTQFINDTSLDPDFLQGGPDKIQSLSELAVPVKLDGKVVSIINIEHNDRNAFTEIDKEVLEILAIQVSQAIRRIHQLGVLEMAVEERTNELVQANAKLQELDTLKDQFVWTIAHELRTPVTSISGYLDLIRNSGLYEVSDQVADLLDVIERNSKRLENITDDFLNYQKIESGGLVLNLVPSRIDAILFDVHEEIKPLFEAKSQSLDIITFDHLPVLRVDPDRIGQVFANLLSNASKFSGEDSVISVKIVECNEEIRVSIRDIGIGIKPEDINKLFKPFPLIHKPTITRKSTGLGLSICKGYIELHGGKIWAESNGSEKGSTFHFSLPLTE